jgi:hypothetical protein
MFFVITISKKIEIILKTLSGTEKPAISQMAHGKRVLSQRARFEFSAMEIAYSSQHEMARTVACARRGR